jgi:hypothetical protein
MMEQLAMAGTTVQALSYDCSLLFPVQMCFGKEHAKARG